MKKKPLIMGICNVTKDSFSDGGKAFTKVDALKHIQNMYNCGADIIDIGAESTRPGSEPISYNREIKKLAPILKVLPKNKFFISIDTNKLETQEFALKNGAHFINDIYGGSNDLFKLSKKYKNGLILMHTPGSPKIMQSKTNSYNNVLTDIKKYFLKITDKLKKNKISNKKVWFDPGIGFGKNLNQNLLILKNLKKLRIQKYGLVIGSSRKSWINKIDNSNVSDRLGGSIASALYAFTQGVDIIRVHDVLETKQAIEIYNKILCSR
ncbi:MAG: Dihydropteroate synthase [Alphaproteobacteria bacterium MarineAlpha5_Bin9]|nr:MAG: Dihydropteroate synthase [Alphaproteobacteria bacterium MarineAlpha5_Bin9]|tara:strand:+ start:36912 stop:37709 length:798 start_codon:yes stop_codon:yes gene_type:complete